MQCYVSDFADPLWVFNKKVAGFHVKKTAHKLFPEFAPVFFCVKSIIAYTKPLYVHYQIHSIKPYHTDLPTAVHLWQHYIIC